MTEQSPTIDYVEHLVKQVLFHHHLTNQVYLKKNNEKLLIQVYDEVSFDQLKKAIDQKLEVGKQMVDIVFVRPEIKSDSWLSVMGDGREGLE